MVAELAAWSGRCDAVLAQLEGEIKKVKADAEKRAKREAKAEKQIKAVTEQSEKGQNLRGGDANSSGVGILGGTRSGHNTRGANKRDQADDDDDDEDAMDVDDGGRAAGGRKKSGFLARATGRGSK